ncbi:M48 family metallopeptidase [Flavobacterium sp. U410]
MDIYRSRFFLSVIFFFAYKFVFSQEVVYDYFPKNKDSIFQYVSKVNDEKVVSFGSKYKKNINEVLKERKEKFIKGIKDSTYIFNKDINIYLNKILKEIYTSNPAIKNKDFYFFVDKSPIPNAACYGNGIFTVNLGLFNFVNSDDELAFILCHEIAHFNLSHNDKALLKYIETINSKETKKQINEVERMSYGKRKAYSDLLEKLNYNFLKRSRTAEVQADSLGYILYKNTKYQINLAAKALNNLQIADSIVFNEDTKLKKHFNFQNYPFKDSWLLKDETLFDVNESINDYAFNKDSLKTHPDIPFRVELLEKMISSTKDKNTTINSSDLKNIKLLASYLIIKTALDEKKLDSALYETLTLYNDGDLDSKSFAIIVSRLLKLTYELKLNHQFGKYVKRVSPFSEEVYLNEVRVFLERIELKNIKKIGLNFCSENNEIAKDNKEFNECKLFFEKLNN